MQPTSPAPSHRLRRHTLAAFLHRDRGLAEHEPGQGLVEYALILVLIAIVSIGAVSMVGRNVSETFDQVNCRLSGGTLHTDNGNGNSTRCRP